MSHRYSLLLLSTSSCSMGPNTLQSLDKVRYVFATKTDKEAPLFPLTDDAFKQHVMLQKQSCCKAHPMGNGNGWTKSNEKLVPVMFEKAAAPNEVRNLIHMYCTDEDCSLERDCLCLQNHLTCTENCSCMGHDCHNNGIIGNGANEDDDSDEDEE